MKNIFLHIGCGKTGSSALQLWLNNNAQVLMDSGIYYPLFGSEKLDDYAITNGNGVYVINAIAHGNIRELLIKIKHESDGDILFSSEVFQNLSENEVLRIRDLISDLGLNPIIIAYVRDVYDMIYSSYLQLIKRHLYAQTFREFALSRHEIQQFNVVRTWSNVFENIKVIHYDSEKGAIDNSFCSALGVERGRIPKMLKAKVNRSLTLEEAELLRIINKAYVDHFVNPDQALCRIISDALIMNDPEAITPILLDGDVVDHVGSVFKADIEWINNRFFEGEKVLSSFNPEGKFIATELPSLDKSIDISIYALISSIKSFDFSERNILRRGIKGSERLDITDPRIIEALRDEAIKREEVSLIDALSLMSAAKTLRPNGPVITRKIYEYKARLSAADA